MVNMGIDELKRFKADKITIGIDEVGRGCLAGPLVVGAVVFSNNYPRGMRDSKKLSASARILLAKEIKDTALLCSTGWVWPEEIDARGLTKATKLAINRAVGKYELYDIMVIDGKINYLPDNNRVITLIGADDLIPEVSAASIVAKVQRDEYMRSQSEQFPAYGFESNVGYGTRSHLSAIKSYGHTSIHRLSFGASKYSTDIDN